jgi:hypothetical protein
MINHSMIEFINQMEESEINYNYTKKRNYDEIQTLGFCPTCNKRLTTGDELYVCELDVYCGESCAIEFKRQEEESA